MRQQLVEQVGGITGEQDRGLASLAWRGGDTIQQTLERFAFSNKEVESRNLWVSSCCKTSIYRD